MHGFFQDRRNLHSPAGLRQRTALPPRQTASSLAQSLCGDVEVVVIDVSRNLAISFNLDYSEIPKSCLGNKLTLAVKVREVLIVGTETRGSPRNTRKDGDPQIAQISTDF